MKKKISLFGRALCLLLCMSMLLTSCWGKQPSNGSASSSAGSSGGESVTYSVEIVSEGDMPISGVGVYVYTDSTLAELVWFEQTDAEGKMSFTDVASDSYVAVLQDVPQGYGVEEYYPITGTETKIVLSNSMTNVDDVEGAVCKLGDMMYDFTVTAVDGKSYTLSELLKEKDAVVLNFWYTNCGPCKSEFPYLQTAYEQYSDKIEVLAMNPVDGDEAAIADFAKDLGLTFPVVKCDPEWEQRFQVVGYPTTVVIDRYGMISLIHSGSITQAGVFEAIFAHYVADDYIQAPVEDVTTLTGDIEMEEEEGTAENPKEFGGVTSFELTIAPGQEVFVDVYKVNGMILSIKNKDAYLIYKDKTYKPDDGTISLTVGEAGDTYNPVKIGVGNSGTETITVTVKFGFKAGSLGRPYSLKLEEFTTKVSAGNDQGVYYTWKATEDGQLTLQNVSCTSGVEFGYTLYNLRSYAQRTLDSDANADENGVKSVSIDVKKGDEVQVIISTLPDKNNKYPAATIKSIASFTAGEVEEEEKVPTLSYGFAVIDDSGAAVAGVEFHYVIEEKEEVVRSNAEGVVAVTLPEGTYTFTMIVPAGYTAETTVFELTKDAPTGSVQLKQIKNLDYVVTVQDDEGNAVSGVTVILGSGFATTDANGTVTFNLAEGNYSGSIAKPAGYVCDETAFTFEGGKTSHTVVLKKLYTYTVTVKGDDDAAVVGTSVTIGEDNIVTDENGQAVFQLTKGNYEAKVAEMDGFVVQSVYSAVVGPESAALEITLQKYYDYTVTVQDQNGVLISGVELTVNGAPCTTDANGQVVTNLLKGDYEVTVVSVPMGSDASVIGTSYKFDNETKSLTITIESAKLAYTVKVVDQAGNGIAGAAVTINGEEVITGEDGIAVSEQYAGSYSAKITVPEGYYADLAEYFFAPGATELIIELMKKVEYTVNVLDQSGLTGVSGVELEVRVSELSGLNMAPVYGITEDGVITFTLPEGGDYLVTVIVAPEGYSFVTKDYLFDAENKLTIYLEQRERFAVAVLDELGNAVKSVGVTFNGDEALSQAVTGNNGVANFSAYVGQSASIVVPDGYRLADGESDTKNFGEANDLTFVLQKLETYTVSVADQFGAVNNVTVSIDGVAYATVEGKVSAILDRGEHTAVITVPDGYQIVGETTMNFGGAYAVSFQLQAMQTYTVSVNDENGGVNGVSIAVGDQTGTTVNGKVSFTLPKGNYSATITVPQGTQLASGTTTVNFGSATEVSFHLKHISTASTYAVTLVDAGGSTVNAEALVTFSSNGVVVASVNAVNGVASAQLEDGTYEVNVYLAAGSGYYATTTKYTLDASNKSVQVLLAKEFAGAAIDHWYAPMYPVTEGSGYVTLTSGGTTYFCFTPERAGSFKVQVHGEMADAKLFYYGSDIFPSKGDITKADNSFTTDIEVGPTIVIGIEASATTTGCVLSVTYMGEIVKLPSVDYDDTKYAPATITLAAGKTLTAIEPLMATTKDLVLGDDGFYYLNGKLVMVDFNWSTLSLSAMVANGNVLRYFDDNGDGTYDRIEKYTEQVMNYLEYAKYDGKSVYPLNPELMYILQNTCAYKGWGDPNSSEYLPFYDAYQGYDLEDAWMSFLVYVN